MLAFYESKAGIPDTVRLHYMYIGHESCGLILVERNREYLYLDTTGSVAIPKVFAMAEDFSEGRATVELNQCSCYIDTRGAVRSKCYNDLQPYSEGRALVTRNDSTIVLDTNGNELFNLSITGLKNEGTQFKNNRLLVRDSTDRLGFLDGSNHLVITCQFNEAMSFSEGLAIVSQSGYWYVIDTNGRRITNGPYDYVTPFRNGRAAVLKKGKWGFINRQGKVCIPVRYQDVREFQHFVSTVSSKGWSFPIDTTGNILDTTIHITLREGYALAEQNGKYGLLDSGLNIVLPFVFDSIVIIPINESEIGYLDVSLKTKHGIYRFDGSQILPASFDSIVLIHNRFFVAHEDRISRLYNVVGQQLDSNTYDSVWKPTNSILALARRGGVELYDLEKERLDSSTYQQIKGLERYGEYLRVKKLNRYGLLQKGLTTLLACEYDTIYSKDWLIYAVKDGKTGMFDVDKGAFSGCLYDTIINKYRLCIGKINGGYRLIDFKCHDNPLYDTFIDARRFDRHIFIRKNGRFGILDMNGKLIGDQYFDQLIDSGETIFVRQGERWSWLDWNHKLIQVAAGNTVKLVVKLPLQVEKESKRAILGYNGEVLSEFIYDSIEQGGRGNVVVSINGKWGLMATSGKSLTSGVFSGIIELKDFWSESQMRYYPYKVIQGGKAGVINHTGREWLPCTYDSTTSFQMLKPDLIITKYRDKFGLIDTSNKVLLPCVYDSIDGVKSDIYTKLIMLKQDKGWYIFDITTNSISNFYFDKIEPPSVFSEAYTLWAIKKGKYVFINRKGELITRQKFDYGKGCRFSSLQDVVRNHKHGRLDKNGKLVIPCRYADISGGRSVNGKHFYVCRLPNNTVDYVDSKGKKIVLSPYDEFLLLHHQGCW